MKNESKNVSIVRMTGVKPARPQMLKKKRWRYELYGNDFIHHAQYAVFVSWSQRTKERQGSRLIYLIKMKAVSRPVFCASGR